MPPHNRALSRLQDRLALVLAAFISLSAVPLASNRVSWWLLWTILLASIAAFYILRAAWLEPRHKLKFLQFGPAFLLAMVVPIWALLQTLPLTPFLPSGLFGMREGLADMVGLAISVQPDIALAGILRFIGYLLLLALVLEVSTRGQRAVRMATIIFAAVVAQAIWAIVALQLLGDVAFWGPKTAYRGMATGTFINRNSLATFLGFGVILGIGILVERDAQMRALRSRRRVAQLGFTGAFILLGILFQFVALLATQSRLGLAATLAAVAVTLLILRRRAGVSVGRLAGEGVLLLVFAAVIIAVFAGGEGVVSRFLFSSTEGQSRIALYSQTLGMIAHRPLSGFGMDSFGFGFEAFRAPPLLGAGTFDLAHNSYLMLWAEFGIIIGSVPPLLLAASSVVLWRRIAKPAGYPGLALAGIGVLVLGGLHSLGDFSLEIPANVYLFLAIIGLGLGQSRSRSPRQVGTVEVSQRGAA